MRSTIVLRLTLAVLGFALGLGVTLAVRYRPPPDLSQPVCPDCRASNTWPVQYQQADVPGKVVPVNSGYWYGSGLFDADPASAVPRPLNGPKYHCPQCQASWGPPTYHKSGRTRRRY